MGGKIIGTVLALLIMTYFILLISFFFLHTEVKGSIKELNYEVCELVSTSGELTRELYDYLSQNVNRYGDYEIKLRLDQRVRPGIYDSFYSPEQIIDRKLRIGDRVIIYLEDKHMSLFGKLINASLLGHVPEKILDTRIKSIKTAVISKNAKDLYKGYDVIKDIQNRLSDPGVAIKVVTGMNPAGKYYGTDSHADVPETNLMYGDTPDERGNTGINYIYDNGDFEKETILYATGGKTRLILYTQQ